MFDFFREAFGKIFFIFTAVLYKEAALVIETGRDEYSFIKYNSIFTLQECQTHFNSGVTYSLS